jgi:D-glycero-D-manno-heptose 1,7-bisphosphate phosphatase
MGGTARRLILLDRDGVINRDSPGRYVTSVAEWEPLPGSLEAIARLTRCGYSIVIVTNQSAVARGLVSLQTLEAIHARMRAAVEQAGGSLAGIYYCPHAPEAGCDCRKPEPGLLRRIERDFGTSLRGVPMIGDKLADLEAAVAVGARPILVLSGYGIATRELLLQRPELAARTQVRADLATAVAGLLDERATS